MHEIFKNSSLGIRNCMATTDKTGEGSFLWTFKILWNIWNSIATDKNCVGIWRSELLSVVTVGYHRICTRIPETRRYPIGVSSRSDGRNYDRFLQRHIVGYVPESDRRIPQWIGNPESYRILSDLTRSDRFRYRILSAELYRLMSGKFFDAAEISTE
jgi:hypothetical protein